MPDPIVERVDLAQIRAEENDYPLFNIRSSGDLILDVTFKNTSQSTRSIPPSALRELRSKKLPLPSPRIFYRVGLERLKKSSGYFRTLLTPPFAEGVAVAEAFSRLVESNQTPMEALPEDLPRVKIEEDDTQTKTIGRELIFRDLLRILHGDGRTPLTTPVSTHSLATLIVMADRFDALPFVTRHCQTYLLSHKYRITQDKNGEETLRQKILVTFQTQQGVKFTAATRELILRGSLRWGSGAYDTSSEYQTSWWDLIGCLEAECAYRRNSVLKAIASIQNQFLAIYASSRERQCKLGYDSSSSCDSFQLGEMVKFLTKKSLLSLVPFQAVSPEDSDYVWPEAYTGEVEFLINTLRQCPSYQIDKNHRHCGFRTVLLEPLDFISRCIDGGLGIKLKDSKNGPVYDSWIPPPTSKSFFVTNEKGEDVDVAGEKSRKFQYSREIIGGAKLEEVARSLFTAEKWNWITEPTPPALLMNFRATENVSRGLPGGPRGRLRMPE